jgi:hypothetical protein
MNQPLRRETFADPIQPREFTAPRRIGDDTCLADLVEVLSAAPAGLRRWSVMRAMRKLAEKRSHEVALKFESDVERVFRFYCESENGAAANEKLFYRPKEKAGDVWAVHMGKAKAWLARDDHSALIDTRTL